MHQGKSANKPLSYGFWLWLPNLLTNLFFLRIETFWGGQLCCLQIGLFSSYCSKENFKIRKKCVWARL